MCGSIITLCYENLKINFLNFTNLWHFVEKNCQILGDSKNSVHDTMVVGTSNSSKNQFIPVVPKFKKVNSVLTGLKDLAIKNRLKLDEAFVLKHFRFENDF